MGSKDEWIAVDEAARRLANRFGGISRARNAIALALFEQMLSAQASFQSQLNGITTQVRQRNAKSGRGITIPREIWSSCYNITEQSKAWDWKAGYFLVEALPPGDSYKFAGVELQKSEVVGLDPRLPLFDHLIARPREDSRVGASDRENPPGRKTPARKWAAIARELMLIHRSGGLDGAVRPTRHGLAVKLLESTNENLGKSMVNEFTTELYELMAWRVDE